MASNVSKTVTTVKKNDIKNAKVIFEDFFLINKNSNKNIIKALIKNIIKVFGL